MKPLRGFMPPGGFNISSKTSRFVHPHYFYKPVNPRRSHVHT
jgi:hypothetical protein